ncbi:MAG: STAS domain-containing protein [Acidimicrobiales bacterium]
MTAPLADLRLHHTAIDAIRVEIDGEIDLSNADQLRERITAGVDGARRVVLDCTDVRYMDSTGVRLIHDLANNLTTNGFELVVTAPAASPAGLILAIAPPSGVAVELS